jgi:peptidoglycan hydrolase-like protein with peptidoglycan-binding domain
MALSELDVAQVTLLQQRLRERGLYLGRIDGIVGPQTRGAVQAILRERFELERRLLEQGQITTELAELVGVNGPRLP